MNDRHGTLLDCSTYCFLTTLEHMMINMEACVKIAELTAGRDIKRQGETLDPGSDIDSLSALEWHMTITTFKKEKLWCLFQMF